LIFSAHLEYLVLRGEKLSTPPQPALRSKISRDFLLLID